MSIEDSIKRLIRLGNPVINTFLGDIESNISVDSTKSTLYIHYVLLDGNGRPRTADLADFVSKKIVDYSIPRSEIKEAKLKDEEENTAFNMTELYKKALTLFTKLKVTGEGGELLLYLLVQEVLQFPQLLCKMPLKTNPNMHYHGVDGIHVDYEGGQKRLMMYWGESKLNQNISTSIKNCFDSLSGFLLSKGGSKGNLERDIQLVKDNLDLLDEDLENELLKYLDKNDSKFNSLEYRGVCLIGFDSDKYPKEINKFTSEKLKGEFKSELLDWTEKIKKGISNISELNSFIIHIFLIPFPSIQEFRDNLLDELGIKEIDDD